MCSYIVFVISVSILELRLTAHDHAGASSQPCCLCLCQGRTLRAAGLHAIVSLLAVASAAHLYPSASMTTAPGLLKAAGTCKLTLDLPDKVALHTGTTARCSCDHIHNESLTCQQ